jgi:hypothetical protein
MNTNFAALHMSTFVANLDRPEARRCKLLSAIDRDDAIQAPVGPAPLSIAVLRLLSALGLIAKECTIH